MSNDMKILPDNGTLLGRVWNAREMGPSVVTIRDGQVIDITDITAPLVRDVCEMEDPLTLIQDLLGGLILLGLALDDGGTAVSRIADIARDECAKLEELRTSIFHALHPDREAAR